MNEIPMGASYVFFGERLYERNYTVYTPFQSLFTIEKHRFPKFGFNDYIQLGAKVCWTIDR